MNRKEILRKAKAAAAINRKKRKDLRYIKVMGFLTAKGFLHTNQDLPLMPNVRLNIEDAVWAGKNVEPRILEVLPAAVIRMGLHFNYDPEKHLELRQAIELLRAGRDGTFFKISLDKVRPWLNLQLKDRRVKAVGDKKVMKTFRLAPQTVTKIRELKKASGKSEAEIIEKLVSDC